MDEPAAPAGTGGDPLAHAVARAARARGWRRRSAALAPLDREVLSLRFEDDLALPQLAETLGVPVPTAKARLYRALARLRERLLARGAGGGVAMSAHVSDLLALAAAGALDPAEQAQVEAHLGECAACAREAAAWRRVAEGLRTLPAPRPSRALVARTVEAVEVRLAERAERAWNRAALGFLVAFAWTLAVLSWLVIDLVTGGLALRLDRSVGPTAAWYAAYVMTGWLTAGAAAALLGRRAQEEGRIA